jgi:hypothetical protein
MCVLLFKWVDVGLELATMVRISIYTFFFAFLQFKTMWGHDAGENCGTRKTGALI